MPYGLDCSSCPRGAKKAGDSICKEWGGETNPENQYAHEGRDLFGEQWSSCPVWYLRSPQGATWKRYISTSLVSPLAGWPDEYAAWVEIGIREGKQALTKRQVEDQEDHLKSVQSQNNTWGR